MGFYGDNLPAAVAAQLRAERGAAGISFKDLAAKTGIAERTLIRYFKGERDVPISTLSLLADAFETSPAEIVSRAVQRIKQ